MKLASFLSIFFINCLFFDNLKTQSFPPIRPDVLAYQVSLQPNFREQTIEGKEFIEFKLPTKTDQVIFDKGNLNILKLTGDSIKGFEQKGKEVIVSLIKNSQPIYTLQIEYRGKPKSGLIFMPEKEASYTVYFTSEWMVCNAIPDDKATLQMEVLTPNHLTTIASGVLVDTIHKTNNNTLYTWRQTYETPVYTYGFTVGEFNKFQEMHNDIQLNYYAPNYTHAEMQTIFNTTGDMLSFFEEKAGVPFPQKSYSQILMGNHYQEMSGFAMLKGTYGIMTLKDSMETNLMAHELAHQWWGNRVTCKNWQHFWLNEGFATFMSAVYNEHCFGQQKYQQDIDAYFKVYEKIKTKGKDKPLVFPNWSNPSQDDRNLVYFKGAYVLHLLRQEVGEDLFWKGIRYYTQKHFGQSVVTTDFQFAMEVATNRNLTAFFETWVY